MNYINEDSIYGLMNKFCECETEHSFWKDKRHTKKVICVSHIEDDSKETSYMYLDNPTGIRGEHSTNQICSIIDETFLQDNLTRQNHRETFETVRKYSEVVVVCSSFEDFVSHYDETIEMIQDWRYELGLKYRWQEHAGIDKAFFMRCLSRDFFERYFVHLFFIEATLVGYSVMPKKHALNEDGIDEVSYVIRKTRDRLNGNKLRNITEYIDWYTFQDYLSQNMLEKIVINWGCSSGGVEWYKEHKWPLYSKEKKWFVKINR